MAIPIFPDYRLEQVDYYGYPGCQITSDVRLKHEDKWYLINHRTIAHSKEEAYRMFIDQTYKTVMFYKINPEAHYTGFLNDELINKPDKDQRDEFTRLFPWNSLEAPGSTIDSTPVSNHPQKDNAVQDLY